MLAFVCPPSVSHLHLSLSKIIPYVRSVLCVLLPICFVAEKGGGLFTSRIFHPYCLLPTKSPTSQPTKGRFSLRKSKCRGYSVIDADSNISTGRAFSKPRSRFENLDGSGIKIYCNMSPTINTLLLLNPPSPPPSISPYYCYCGTRRLLTGVKCTLSGILSQRTVTFWRSIHCWLSLASFKSKSKMIRARIRRISAKARLFLGREQNVLSVTVSVSLRDVGR